MISTNKSQPLVSILIATYNSEKKLPMVLKAIREQSYPQDRIEILIIDGGSTDKTKALAQAVGAKIIDNPRTEPVYAKYLGLHAAQGEIAVILDHDEVYTSPQALKNQMAVFNDNPDVHAVITSGYKNPDDYPFINLYVNEFGDPFSAFVYRLSKDYRFLLPNAKRKFTVVKENEQQIIFDFKGCKDLPLFELVAGGGAIRLNFFKTEFKTQFDSPTEYLHFFFYMQEKTQKLGLAKDSTLLHYSSETFSGYQAKIRWRIKNNIFFIKNMGAAGFQGRLRFQGTTTKLRKFLYLPYSLLLLPLALDSLYLCLTRRNLKYLLHIYLSLYTTFSILFYMCLRALGYSPQLRSYDELKTISTPSNGK